MGRTLGTIQAAAALIIEGIGSLGICSIAMHVPEASANLLPTDLISDAECTVKFGKSEGNYYCDIKCHQGINDKRDIKFIEATRHNNVWWIPKTAMLDILFRGVSQLQSSKNFKEFAILETPLHIWWPNGLWL